MPVCRLSAATAAPETGVRLSATTRGPSPRARGPARADARRAGPRDGQPTAEPHEPTEGERRATKRRDHRRAPSTTACDGGIVPRFGDNGMTRRGRVHDLVLQLADEVPSVVAAALQELLRGIPGVQQHNSGLTREPMARVAEEFEGQVVLRSPPGCRRAACVRRHQSSRGGSRTPHRGPSTP